MIFCDTQREFTIDQPNKDNKMFTEEERNKAVLITLLSSVLIPIFTVILGQFFEPETARIVMKAGIFSSIAACIFFLWLVSR